MRRVILKTPFGWLVWFKTPKPFDRKKVKATHAPVRAYWNRRK